MPARPGRRWKLPGPSESSRLLESSRAQSSRRKNATPCCRQRRNSRAKSSRNGPPSISAWMVSTWGARLRRDRTRSLKSRGRQPSRPRSSSRVGRVVGISRTGETVGPNRGNRGWSPGCRWYKGNSGPPAPCGCRAALPARGGEGVGGSQQGCEGFLGPVNLPGDVSGGSRKSWSCQRTWS